MLPDRVRRARRKRERVEPAQRVVERRPRTVAAKLARRLEGEACKRARELNFPILQSLPSLLSLTSSHSDNNVRQQPLVAYPRQIVSEDDIAVREQFRLERDGVRRLAVEKRVLPGENERVRGREKVPELRWNFVLRRDGVIAPYRVLCALCAL